MQTPPFGVTIVHDTVVFFFMSIHINDCSCVPMCGLSVVRTVAIYIRTYRTYLLVWYNCVYSIWLIRWPHHTLHPWLIPRIILCVATMNDAVRMTMWHNQCINHMIFRGYNTHTIHFMALHGAFTPRHVCLYTLPILHTV